MNILSDGDATEGSNPGKQAMPASTAAKREVDPRMHSAEHLLTATMMQLLGCGRPFTTHLEKKKSKADFRYSRDLAADEIQQIEARVNQIIVQNLSVREELLPRPQAAQRYDLARLPESAGETVRIVHIGDYDACPCSGQHVRETREIGHFRIISTAYEAGALRVRFKLDAIPGTPE